MKIQKIGYIASLSDDTVISCGNNYSFYKIKTLESELWHFSESGESWMQNNRYCSFSTILQSQLKETKKIDIKQDVFSVKGVDAEIIDPKLNKPLKGKFRISFALEFIPDEPDDLESNSLLDEIRREMQSDPQ